MARKYKRVDQNCPNSGDYQPKNYAHIREVYEKQVKKFEKLGLGGVTEFGTVVTPELCRITEQRLRQIRKLTYRFSSKAEEKSKQPAFSSGFQLKLDRAEEKAMQELLDAAVNEKEAA